MQTQTKLDTLEASIKRWNTRLTRAHNMLRKLYAQRAREQKRTVKALGLTFTPNATHQIAAVDVPKLTAPITVQPVDPAIVDDIPAVLDRRDPEVKAKLEAAREEAKKKMPLNEREALAHIRKRSIAVEKKREKRDRAFFKKA
jgi:hypothetical protein